MQLGRFAQIPVIFSFPFQKTRPKLFFMTLLIVLIMAGKLSDVSAMFFKFCTRGPFRLSLMAITMACLIGAGSSVLPRMTK